MNQYILPFKAGDIIAEFGGGSAPMFHPNFDVRNLPTVDHIIDFNEEFDIPDNSFHGIYGSYVLEHISWRRVRQFLREVYRTLKPNSIVVFVTANLIEQCRVVANSTEWEENFSCMLFGDLDYLENSHKCGFSPEYAKKLFEDAGFTKVEVREYPNCKTDMIIEAHKLEIESGSMIIKDTEYKDIKTDIPECKIPYNRAYFDGDTRQGYHPPGYQNFPSNYTIANEILKMNPESILELGGCRGYISHIIEGKGINATCLDIAKHCFYTRTCKNFVLSDASDRLPFEDKQFDLVFSKDFLEHIPEEKVYNLIKEIVRVSKRGFHLITFSDHPHSRDDSTHQCIKPKDWWIEKFKSIQDYNCIIEDKEKYERTDLDIIKIFHSPSNIFRINIGSYTQMYYNWENWDILDLKNWALSNGFNFNQVDITKQLPKVDNSVELINCSHTLEHITREEGLSFLKECHRVLKPEGIIRMSIPDTYTICKAYMDKKISDYREFNIGVEKSKDDAQALYHMLIDGHKTIFDFESLKLILEDAGFSDIKKMKFLESRSPIIEKEIVDMYPEISIYVEAIKANTDKEVNDIVPTKKGPIITTGPIIKEGIKEDTIKDKLRIALISTPFFSVPPKKYGGLEQVIWDLAVGLDELGHDITIFGPEGSIAPKNGHLIITGPSNNSVNVDWLKLEKDNYERYKEHITPEKFDIIHDHSWFSFAYLSKMNNQKLKVLHTNHGGYSWESSPPVSHPNLVAISVFMKQYTIQYFKQIGYNVKCEYIYNGIDLDKYPFDPNVKKTNRLLYVGRFSKFKRPHIAIEVAKKINLPIDLIGGTFVDDINYLKEIESMCDEHNIVIYKDASHDFKIKKMQETKCLIFPSKMGEPLGLVAQEAMSCGTPVVASNDGAIPEVVLHGKTGFICNTEDEMIEAIKNIDKINPLECRKRAEEFSRLQMAKNYEKLYYRILDNDEW